MSIQYVLLPVFVLVVLTFVLLFWTAHLRVGAVRRGNVHPRDVALREKDFGIWQAFSWAQYQDWVEKRALRLHKRIDIIPDEAVDAMTNWKWTRKNCQRNFW